MAQAKKNESYSVGVKELDERYQALYKIFFILLETENGTLDSPERAEALQRLRNYVYKPFELKEEYGANCRHPDLESHIRIHESFRKKIEDLFSAATEKQDPDVMEILYSLYDWLNAQSQLEKYRRFLAFCLNPTGVNP